MGFHSVEQDVTLDEAREFIQEMDYSLTDTTGKLSIADTEVVSDDIEGRVRAMDYE